MRIVVATLYEAVGGSSKVLLAASEALRAEHEVIVRAPLPSADSRILRPLSELVLDSWPRKLATLPALMRILASEWSFAGQSRPDVFYVHDEPSLYVYGLIGRLRGVRVVWHVHMREGEGMRRVLRNALCDAKLFVSRALVSLPQTKPWTVAANPIAVGQVARRAVSGARVLGMLGSISKRKNQELGLRVLAELRWRAVPVRLVIFGNVLETDYRERLTELTSSLGLSGAVEFRGFVPTEQALAEIDVLLACSTFESFGLAVAEALATGVPVVATDIVAHREFSSAAPSSALTICAADPVEMARAAMAAGPDENLTKQIRQRFSRERFAAAVTEFFRGLAQAQFRGLTSAESPR
jgi:glycosyltransferase involved in cell wall biosynthesis